MNNIDKNTISNFIPVISEGVEIHPLETGLFLIQQQKYGYNLQVNIELINILKFVNDKRTINEINKLYTKKYEINISNETIYELLHNKLSKYGIISLNNFIVENKKREKHLFLSFTIFNAKVVNKIVNPLTFLFQKKLFYILFSVFIIFSYTTILLSLEEYKKHVDEILSAKFIISFICLYFIFISHEFGHAAAGKKFGSNPKNIGFGFYWILPVFFSDMSNAWKLKRSEKIIVNLGGIFFDLMSSSILLILFFITRKIIFLVIPTIIAFSTLRNLNFFLKYDGYWVISDWLKIPNLQKNSYKKLNEIIKKIKLKEPIKLKWKDYFLIFYSITSLFYLIFILIFLLILNPNSLLFFPKHLFEIINSLIFSKQTVSLLVIKPLIIPFLFYLILFIKIIKFLKQKTKKHYGTKRDTNSR